jgi:hypothetical protein
MPTARSTERLYKLGKWVYNRGDSKLKTRVITLNPRRTFMPEDFPNWPVIQGLMAVVTLVILPGSIFVLKLWVDSLFKKKLQTQQNTLQIELEEAKQELAKELDNTREALKRESDKLSKIYDLYMRDEYALYQEVYSKLVDAFHGLVWTRSMGAEFDLAETTSPIGDDEKKMREARKEQLRDAYSSLNFYAQVEKRRPFIPTNIFYEIKKFHDMGFDTFTVKRFPTLYKAPFTENRKSHSNEEVETQLDTIGALIRSRLRVED